jgi:hypothetical protein
MATPLYYVWPVACVALLLLHSLFLLAEQPPTCADLASCRQAALEAAARQDFETFHDLAWRTAQKGRPNDPELMYLLARAQSLSGRPGDALVMLRRLAEMGVATDARDSEDFRRVRALPGWADVEALIAAAGDKRPLQTAARSTETGSTKTQASSKSPARSDAASSSALAANPKAGATTATAPATTTAGAEETLRLEESALDPVGLAYDSASRRFVVGDRHLNKLIVADEVFKRVNDLIGAASAGFGTLTGVEIDTQRGDLWVTSSAADGAASVHKLQLVSGRVLSTINLPDDLRPATFSDFSVGDSGALLLLDSTGARLLTLKAGARAFDRPVSLGVASPASVAPAGSVTYVAHDAGLSVADTRSGRTTAVRAANGVATTGLRRIRWTRGALVAIQRDATGSDQLVRIRLDRNGTRASAVEPLDNHVAVDGSALTISRDAAYYVARTDTGPVIRRVPLR